MKLSPSLLVPPTDQYIRENISQTCKKNLAKEIMIGKLSKSNLAADHGNWDRGPSCERSPLSPRHKPVCGCVFVCDKKLAKEKASLLQIFSLRSQRIFNITDNYSLVDQNDHTLKKMNKEVGVGGHLLVVVQQAPE